MLGILRTISCAFVLTWPLTFTQQPVQKPTTASEAPNSDTSYIDANGTAHITRVVSVPQDLSPEAQKFISQPRPDVASEESVAAARRYFEVGAPKSRAAWSKLCPNTIEEAALAGVPVHMVTPDNMPASNRDKVLMNLHGGGFSTDSGSYTESIPVAGYAGIKVVSVLYRLAPEHPYPAAVDDAVAVYKELLKTYTPNHIGIYGTSAGATLTAEVAVRLKQLSLPMPAALGIFSTIDSFARMGDSVAIFTSHGLGGPLAPPDSGSVHDGTYLGAADPKDPVVSPIYADLHGMPPALFVTSGRDMLLSSTTNLHRAYLRAGVDARLVVFDGLPHAFWYRTDLPESIEANHIMAKFFVEHLTR
jgi:epsilon-lactone hydrolase